MHWVQYLPEILLWLIIHTRASPATWMTTSHDRNSEATQLHKAQIPLRQLATLRQSCWQNRQSWIVSATKSATFSWTQFMTVSDTNHVADFHDLCCGLSWFVFATKLRTLSLTFPVYCNKLNSIRVTQTCLSQTCYELCRKHLDMSRWFVSATFSAGKFRWKSA